MNTAKGLVMLLLSMTSFTCYILNSTSPIHIKMDSKVLASTFDAIVSDLSVQQYDTEGHLTHSLTTPLLQHIPTDNKHLIKAPHIIVQEANQAPWEIRSEEAVALHGGSEITFHKQVMVHQKQYQQTESTLLTTDEITYFPQSKTAQTLKEVTLQQANNQIKSIGMKAFLAENRIEFLDNTRGHYAPQHG